MPFFPLLVYVMLDSCLLCLPPKYTFLAPYASETNRTTSTFSQDGAAKGLPNWRTEDLYSRDITRYLCLSPWCLCVYLCMICYKLDQNSFASPVKTSSKSNTINETHIYNLVGLRWNLSFNLIPICCNKTQNGQVMGTYMTQSQFWKIAPNDRCARWKWGVVQVIINSRIFLHSSHFGATFQ